MTIQAANRDKAQLLKELHTVKTERDDSKRKASKSFAENAATAKDVSRLRVERDAVVHEYTLVMSERDSVHKEIETLQDRLARQLGKLDGLERDHRAAVDETDSLRVQLTTALREREVTRKQFKNLKEKQGGVDVERYRDDVALRDHDLCVDRDGCGDGRYGRANKESLHLDSNRKEMEGLQSDLSGRGPFLFSICSWYYCV